ncbi:MAG: class I SAM-dependent methyltransferase [Spirulina sp.]
MNSSLELNEYKTRIADLYDRRSSTYDESQWHLQICQRLLEGSQIHSGQRILDIGTGTGHLAIAAARIVGTEGRVIGVDLSGGMLAEAEKKIARLSLKNIEFCLADAEKLAFSPAQFDRIFCANTFPWIEEKEAALCLWYDLLKPNGLIGIHTPADTAYIGYVLLRKIFAEYGVNLEFSNRLGSLDTCRDLFAKAGFTDITIATEQQGSYLSLEKARSAWNTLVHLFPSRSPDPLAILSSEQLESAEKEFRAELEARNSDRGIWNDLATWYIVAQKPR